MRVSILALSSALLSPASAHYFFGRLILDGKWTETWEYIREISPVNNTDEIALQYPNTNPDSLDLRCGRNASNAWSKPKTATIQAGAKVGFAIGKHPNGGGGLEPTMYHPGFGSAWLSKSPTEDLNAYAGDGDWAKILQIVERTEQSVDWTKEENKKKYDATKAWWGTWHADSWNFTIPVTTPPGKYLLRFEHIFPNKWDAQYYVNCAHIEVVNPSATVGTPSPTVKIPGVYTRGQPDVYFSSYDYYFTPSLMPFIPPKPEVWKG
ncbi:glycoside hydrolase [Massariosphaeria phaeospora]|uniref:AA9 family lytic polysaccharide monooxygenase n=1 Tax=Massariosphaeria phaeospora TaxID=100035 RepID=A0A7C8M5I4_9PLEO|nr:glycoside hydrolase [Massariosphaeria phaeospora]